MSCEVNNFSWQIFVYNIVWLRKHYEFSEEKMAEIMEISVDLLKQIELGQGADKLSVEVIYKIYNFFGVLPNILMGKKLGE